MAFKPSPLQQAIYDWISGGTGSAIIEAVAGSGKTTTIVNALELIPSTLQVIFLAFNKSIAEELASRVPDFVQVKTLNAAGARALGRYLGRFPKVDANKTRNIIRNMRLEEGYIPEITKLVALAKSHGIVPASFNGATPVMRDDTNIWYELVDRFDLEIPSSMMPYVIQAVRDILTASLWERQVIDFDDQLYMPVVLGANFERNDWVFVDEAQDVSPIQRAMLRKLLKPGGRLVAVGDPCQAIYGFRGADSASLGNIAKEFNAVIMPLSMSYRCPQKVVEHAQTVVSHIEASPTAIEGSVQEWKEYDGSEFRPDDMVICRNTAPLIKLAYGLIGKHIGATVMGRDIGTGLVKLIDKLKPKGIDGDHGLIVKLDNWVQKETQKLLTQDKEDRVQAVEDKADSIMAFIEGSKADTVPKLKEDITEMFGKKQKNAVTLCTVHKSKGLEAKRVFVLDDHLMPSKYARQEWQQEQERNLRYVAYTRAQEDLIFITGDSLVAKKSDQLNKEIG